MGETREGSSRSQQLSLDSEEVFRGELPANAVVFVSINVSEDGKCITAIRSNSGTPAFSEASEQQISNVERCNVDSCNAARMGSEHSPDGSPPQRQEETPEVPQPLQLSDSTTDRLQQLLVPQHAPWSAPPAPHQPRYLANPPRTESSPDIVLTSMNSPPSAQQCPSPTSSAHFDAQQFCEQDPTASTTFLQERLHAKAEEIAELKAEVRRLQRSRMLSVEGLPTSGDTVTIPAAELSAMKKDLEDQERIISAYGDENRAAAQQVKALEARSREKDEEMRGERQRLESELVRNMEAQRIRSAGTASKLQRVLQLEGQLTNLQEEAEVRQTEMQAAIDTLRQDKRKLEAQVAGVNLHAVEAGDPLVLQVREEMSAMKAQYEAHVSALQEKLEWYANNQRLLTENDDLLARQADTISELRKRLEAQPSGKAAAQRIADLNKQVSELKRALAGSEKGVLATLVREAAAPLHEQEAEAQALRQEVARQTALVAEVEEAAERKQRALEQQLENYRVRCDGAGDASRGTTVAAAATADAEAARQQVEQVRSRYQQQIQNLQGQLQAERAARVTGDNNVALDDMTNTMRESSEDGLTGEGVRTSHSGSKQWVRLRQQQAEARKTILAKENIIASLQSQLQRQQEQTGYQSKASEEHVASLQSHLRDVREDAARQAAARDVLQAELRAATDGQRRSEDARHHAEQRAATECSTLHTQVAELSSRLEASQAVAASVQQSVTAVTSALAEAREQHTAELRRMSAANETLVAAAAREAAAAEARAGCDRTLRLESELVRAQQRLATLEEELQVSKHSKVWAPSAREMVVLENQIREMSQQLSAQRMQWPQASTPPLQAHSPRKRVFDHDGTMANAAVATGEGEVQSKLVFLQDQVEKVIQFASALQKHRESVGVVRQSGDVGMRAIS